VLATDPFSINPARLHIETPVHVPVSAPDPKEDKVTKKINRRSFIRATAVTAGAAALAACGAPATPAPAPTPLPEATKAPEPTVAPTEAPAAAPEPTAAPTEAPAAAPAEGCQIDWTPTNPPSPKVYDPPVEIKVITNPRSEYYPEGMSYGNNPAWQEILDNTHIKWTTHWEEGAGVVTAQKLAADLAAGTLPDMFATGGLFLEQLIEADAIADIKSVWDATASPLTNQKKRYPDFKWWKQTLREDKLWGIPFVYGPAYNVDNLPFVRQDWLDKLGLEAPTTVEGWGETAKAFKDAGLCQFGINACQRLVTWYMSLDPVFGAYGVMPTCWVKAEDGTLKYDSVSPKVKDALALIRQWYADGLIDPDFYTFGEGDAAGHIDAGKIGIYTSPWWRGGADIQSEGATPGMKIGLMPYPKGPDGKQGRKASGEAGNCVVFRKGLDPVAIEAAINNLNWHTERHTNWAKYQQYGEWRNNHWFGENIEWKFDENCELVPGPITKADSYTWMAYVDFGFIFGGYPEYQAEMFQEIAKWQEQDPATLNKAQRYILTKSVAPREALYYNAVFDSRDAAMPNEYWGNPTQAMQEVQPDLDTLESQTFIDIVVGNQDLDAFDDFAKEWQSSGGETMTKDINEWYKATFG